MDASQHTPGSAVYVGFDPTADSLHTGNLMAIMALLHFRHAGYQPIAVVRDAILLFLSSLCHIFSNYIAPPRKIEINLPLPHCWLRDTIIEKNLVDRFADKTYCNIVPPVSQIRWVEPQVLSVTQVDG